MVPRSLRKTREKRSTGLNRDFGKRTTMSINFKTIPRPALGIIFASLTVFTLFSCRQPDELAANAATSAPPTHAYNNNVKGAPHNVLVVTDGVISGSAPEGDAGFDALAAMGINTVISVDGATPDLNRARARNMRYVHIPTGYDGVHATSRDQLAAALAELPKPVYVHCHHGKHRGPAAAAVGAVALGKLTPEQGIEFLERAGTSLSYPGLYQSVRETARFDSARADAIAATLPEIARVSDFVTAMSEIDRAADHLELCQQAAWNAPADHPDLVPQTEADRLAMLFRQIVENEEYARRPAHFHQLMEAGAFLAERLVQALTHGQYEKAHDTLTALDNNCRECHNAYRNLLP